MVRKASWDAEVRAAVDGRTNINLARSVPLIKGQN